MTAIIKDPCLAAFILIESIEYCKPFTCGLILKFLDIFFLHVATQMVS